MAEETTWNSNLPHENVVRVSTCTSLSLLYKHYMKLCVTFLTWLCFKAGVCSLLNTIFKLEFLWNTQLSIAIFKPVCRSTLVCLKWSASVLRELGIDNVSVGPLGDVKGPLGPLVRGPLGDVPLNCQKNLLAPCWCVLRWKRLTITSLFSQSLLYLKHSIWHNIILAVFTKLLLGKS